MADKKILKSGEFLSGWAGGRNGEFRTKELVEIFEADFGNGPVKQLSVTVWKQYREDGGIELDRGWNRQHSSWDGNRARIEKYEELIDSQ